MWAFSPSSRPCMCLGILCASTDTTTPPMGAFQQQLTTLPSSSQQQHNSLSFFLSRFSCILSLSLSSLPFLSFSVFFYISFFFTPSRPASSSFVSFLLHQKSILYISTATVFLSVSLLSFLLIQYTQNKNSPIMAQSKFCVTKL